MIGCDRVYIELIYTHHIILSFGGACFISEKVGKRSVRNKKRRHHLYCWQNHYYNGLNGLLFISYIDPHLRKKCCHRKPEIVYPNDLRIGCINQTWQKGKYFHPGFEKKELLTLAKVLLK